MDCVACLCEAAGEEGWSNPERRFRTVQEAPAFVSQTGRLKVIRRYPIRPPILSIENRSKKLQELNARTECKDCGRKGHWHGDRECTQ